MPKTSKQKSKTQGTCQQDYNINYFNRTRTICHIQKYEVMTMSSRWSAKKHENTIYKATKHIKPTFFIPDYY